MFGGPVERVQELLASLAAAKIGGKAIAVAHEVRIGRQVEPVAPFELDHFVLAGEVRFLAAKLPDPALGLAQEHPGPDRSIPGVGAGVLVALGLARVAKQQDGAVGLAREASQGVDETGDVVGVGLLGAVDLDQVIYGRDLRLVLDDPLPQGLERGRHLEVARAADGEGIRQAEPRDQVQPAGHVGHGDAERGIDLELPAQDLGFIIFREKPQRLASLDLEAEPLATNHTAGQQQLRDRALAGATGSPEPRDARERNPLVDDPAHWPWVLGHAKVDLAEAEQLAFLRRVFRIEAGVLGGRSPAAPGRCRAPSAGPPLDPLEHAEGAALAPALGLVGRQRGLVALA